MTDTLLNAPETSAFVLQNLLYSRTDKRGVIRSANAAFREVSGYEWEELFGAPHKLVRNPGMPRGAFHLMWSSIEAGNPIGMYVVNRTKQNLAYTLFAVAMPVDDEYVSVRVKPTSARADKVKAIYDKLRAREVAENLEPEVSQEILVSEIKAMGYTDYDAFMSDSLEEEIGARCETLGFPASRELTALSAIGAAVEKVANEALQLEELLRNTDQIPYNMRLQASRLEGRDGPISVISANHQAMTDTFNASLKSFLAATQKGAAPVRNAKFLTGTSGLLHEVAGQIGSDTETQAEHKAADLDAVARLRAHYGARTGDAVLEGARQAEYFDRVCKEMRRMVFGLEMTRTMCNIERSKSSGDTEALDGIVARLQSAEKQLTKMMSEVEGAVYYIKNHAEGLLNDQRKSIVGAVAAE